MKWIPTNKHVYGAIYREHYEDFAVFGSMTAPEGDLSLGYPNPRIVTEWGFKDADEPIIRSAGTKNSLDQKEYDYEYWIASYTKES